MVSGLPLKPLFGTPLERLRLYAFRRGKLRPIPYQIDERTSEGRLAYERGELRRSDTDDKKLDKNDELVCMAWDLGARIDLSQVALGQELSCELRVRDRKGREAWAYLLRFPQQKAPRRSPTRYVTLTERKGEVWGWSSPRVEVLGPSAYSHLLYPHSLRFRGPKGALGPDLLDRAKLSLKASYLYLTLRRQLDEVRASPHSWRVGPVRAVAGIRVETYLIWSHWIRSSAETQLRIYANRVELDAGFVLPVALERTRESHLRFTLDFAPQKGLWLWTDRNPRALRARGNRKSSVRLERKGPSWICANSPQGSVLLRFRPQGELEKRPRKLFLEDETAVDPPEDHKGSFGNAGVVVDLSGAAAGTYRCRLSMHFGKTLKAPGGERALLEIEDHPLQVRAGTK